MSTELMNVIYNVFRYLKSSINITCSESDHPTLYYVISNSQRQVGCCTVPFHYCSTLCHSSSYLRNENHPGGFLISNDSLVLSAFTFPPHQHFASLWAQTAQTLQQPSLPSVGLTVIHTAHNGYVVCVTSGFCHDPDEICNLLGYYTTQNGNVGQPTGPIFLEFLTLEDGTNRLS